VTQRLLDNSAALTAAVSDKPAALKAAERLEHWARANGIGRTLAWQAAHPDPDYRRGLPFLPTFTLGRCRLVRIETANEWLRELERSATARAAA
jgi:hypothetical protein